MQDGQKPCPVAGGGFFLQGKASGVMSGLGLSVKATGQAGCGYRVHVSSSAAGYRQGVAKVRAATACALAGMALAFILGESVECSDDSRSAVWQTRALSGCSLLSVRFDECSELSGCFYCIRCDSYIHKTTCCPVLDQST